MGRAFEKRKARKMARWSKVAKVFTRMGKEISLAAKSGGGDPDNNPRLRIAIQNARSVNMPKDTIEKAIKKATDKDSANLEELLYEGYGPHGIAVMVDCASDNSVRTVANVRSYFNKTGGSLGKSGSVEFMFSRKAFFTIAAEGRDIEELELDLIDFGLEEIDHDPEENQIVITTDFTDYGNMQAGLEEKGIEVVKADLERVPHNTKTLNEEQKEEMNKLLEKLEEDDDVLAVFHNMEE